jgi:hypothetical protein
MLWVYVDAAPAFPFPKQVKKYGKKSFTSQCFSLIEKSSHIFILKLEKGR